MNNFNYYNYYHNNYNVTAYRYNDIIFILIDYRIDNYKNQSCNLWPICVLDILTAELLSDEISQEQS